MSATVELYDIEAESEAVGIILLTPAALDRLPYSVSGRHFFDPCLGALWDEVVKLYHETGAVDISSLCMRFAGQEWFIRFGGREYIGMLVDKSPIATALPGICQTITTYSARRRLRDVAAEIARLSEDPDTPVGSAVMAAEEAIQGVYGRLTTKDEWIGPQALIEEVNVVTSPDYVANLIPTGIDAFDEKFGGVRPGKMTVLAARASMGKSTVALTIASGMASKGYGVGIFSLEMDDREVAIKIGCALAYNDANLPHENPSPFFAETGRMYADNKRALRDGAQAMRDWPLSVDKRSGLTPSQILPATRRLIRKWQKEGVKPGCIIIDHLHVVTPEIDRGGNRVAEIGDISGFLTEMAKQTGVAVISMCQLNRGVEDRANKDKRPQLSDIRGSGKVEEDAFMVGFIYRPEYYLREPEDKTNHAAMEAYEFELDKYKNKLFFIVEKNRSGPRGEVQVNCSMEHGAVWS